MRWLNKKRKMQGVQILGNVGAKV